MFIKACIYFFGYPVITSCSVLLVHLIMFSICSVELVHTNPSNASHSSNTHVSSNSTMQKMAPLNNHNNSAKIMSACSFLFSISFILSSVNLFHQYFFSLQYFPFSVPLVIDGSVISNIMSYCLSAHFQCLIVSILFVRTFVIFFSSVNFYLDSNFAPYFPSFSKRGTLITHKFQQ